MKPYRYDYIVNDNGRYERVKSDIVYAWAAINMTTGEVDLCNIREFGSDLPPLISGWDWKKFTLTLT